MKLYLFLERFNIVARVHNYKKYYFILESLINKQKNLLIKL